MSLTCPFGIVIVTKTKRSVQRCIGLFLPKEITLNYPWIQEELSKTENAIYLKDELTS